MKKSQTTRTIVIQTSLVVITIFCLIVGWRLINQIPLLAAKPPNDLKTIEDFRKWKQNAIIGSGTFENSGATYIVMLAPAGRYLSSGPSAYLFKQNGEFIDWTADMGDFYTIKNHFDLTGDNVKNVEHQNQRRQP